MTNASCARGGKGFAFLASRGRPMCYRVADSTFPGFAKTGMFGAAPVDVRGLANIRSGVSSGVVVVPGGNRMAVRNLGVTSDVLVCAVGNGGMVSAGTDGSAVAFGLTRSGCVVHVGGGICGAVILWTLSFCNVWVSS